MTFPLMGLDLAEFNTGARERAAAGGGGGAAASSLYNCIAIVNHVGQLKGGHCAWMPPLPPPPSRIL